MPIRLARALEHAVLEVTLLSTATWRTGHGCSIAFFSSRSTSAAGDASPGTLEPTVFGPTCTRYPGFVPQSLLCMNRGPMLAYGTCKKGSLRWIWYPCPTLLNIAHVDYSAATLPRAIHSPQR
ncbi:hypothetical protein P3342_005223 [Pyrenophora teres f. teres]|nr:hypothetical protein P3342_005223 [Pyrenophora teres f. teres]